tara:strand:- start:2934 stop:3110 length:177 start_codon:yes stop_codon:yes gene_type:complete
MDLVPDGRMSTKKVTEVVLIYPRIYPMLHYSMTNPIPPMCFALDWFRASMPPAMGAAR